MVNPGLLTMQLICGIKWKTVDFAIASLAGLDAEVGVVAAQNVILVLVPAESRLLADHPASPLAFLWNVSKCINNHYHHRDTIYLPASRKCISSSSSDTGASILVTASDLSSASEAEWLDWFLWPRLFSSLWCLLGFVLMDLDLERAIQACLSGSSCCLNWNPSSPAKAREVSFGKSASLLPCRATASEL